MKKDVVPFILIFLVVFIVFIIVSSVITVKKYDDIAKHINTDIKQTKKEIVKKNKKLEKLKSDNETKEKQTQNMDSYIETLSERLKQYEK